MVERCRPPDTDKGFLQRIFCGVFTPQHTKRNAEQMRVGSLVQLGEGGVVTLRREREEIPQAGTVRVHVSAV